MQTAKASRHPTIPSSIGLFPPALNFCQHQGLFQWISTSHQVAKFWSFSFSISPSSEYSGLISFRTDWFELLAVQGTLKSLLQHHSSKVSILWLVWYSHLFQNFPVYVIHTVQGFGIVNKAEIDVFLELSCFFHDPVDVGNLIFGSSAFPKTSTTSGSLWFTYC